MGDFDSAVIGAVEWSGWENPMRCRIFGAAIANVIPIFLQ
jgi:hypothetical protein